MDEAKEKAWPVLETPTRALALVSCALGILAVTVFPVRAGLLRSLEAGLWSHWTWREMAVKSLESGPGDVFFNILLFLPLGFFARGDRPARHRGLWIALAGFSFSFAIETLQSGIPGRFPSLVDLATNTFGAWLGQALAHRMLSSGEAVQAGGK
jgi:hypothetical protein